MSICYKRSIECQRYTQFTRERAFSVNKQNIYGEADQKIIQNTDAYYEY